eukprot:CAMPEP_0182484274 /NCGR_PEP_ID=MMETSP1319-20130603/43130_1 /TAXON_ID=172717 /ORGANISM="Bolidomonas pacifica, Strain RCC208" /LENGTH=346 /DNA_ID=CAMNT_0024686165 /DNA_START=179 /DNA_END=1215 /DNA_ORIENTATION=-
MPTITGRYALGTAQYHCPVCNVYFASSTAAIRAHENGKKHLEKVREARDAKRERRKEEEKVRREIEKEIKGIDVAVKRGMEEGFYEAKGPGVGSEGLKEWKKKREEEKKKRSESRVPGSSSQGSAQRAADGAPLPPFGGSSVASEEDEGWYQVGDVKYVTYGGYPNCFVADAVVEAYVGPEGGEKEWTDAVVAEVESVRVKDGLDVKRFRVEWLDGDDEEREATVSQKDVRGIVGEEGMPEAVGEDAEQEGKDDAEGQEPEPPKLDEYGVGEWTTVTTTTVTIEEHERQRAEADRAREQEEELRAAERKRKVEIDNVNLSAIRDDGDSALKSFNVYGGSGYKGVEL